MASEGQYPKANQDILYPSEVNAFDKICGTIVLTDTTQESTQSTTFTELKSYTVSGITGVKLVLITMELHDGDGGSDIRLQVGGKWINTGADYATARLYDQVSPIQVTAIAFVSNNDTIKIYAKVDSAAYIMYLDKVYIWSGAWGISIS